MSAPVNRAGTSVTSAGRSPQTGQSQTSPQIGSQIGFGLTGSLSSLVPYSNDNPGFSATDRLVSSLFSHLNNSESFASQFTQIAGNGGARKWDPNPQGVPPPNSNTNQKIEEALRPGGPLSDEYIEEFTRLALEKTKKSATERIDHREKLKSSRDAIRVSATEQLGLLNEMLTREMRKCVNGEVFNGESLISTIGFAIQAIKMLVDTSLEINNSLLNCDGQDEEIREEIEDLFNIEKTGISVFKEQLEIIKSEDQLKLAFYFDEQKRLFEERKQAFDQILTVAKNNQDVRREEFNEKLQLFYALLKKEIEQGRIWTEHQKNLSDACLEAETIASVERTQTFVAQAQAAGQGAVLAREERMHQRECSARIEAQRAGNPGRACIIS